MIQLSVDDVILDQGSLYPARERLCAPVSPETVSRLAGIGKRGSVIILQKGVPAARNRNGAMGAFFSCERSCSRIEWLLCFCIEKMDSKIFDAR